MTMRLLGWDLGRASVRCWRIALKKSGVVLIEGELTFGGGSAAWGYAGPGVGSIGMSFASFRRFCAAAARRNSSRAPFGPRSRKRRISVRGRGGIDAASAV